MPRLIDADKAIEWVTAELKAMAYTTAVDAVELVRCRDCRYYYADGCDECGLLIGKSITATCCGKRWYSDFYCAWGERKEDGEREKE